MRPTLAALAAVAAAALAANILGEYELTPVVAATAGVVVGFLIGELLVSGGRWTGWVPAALGAALSAGSILWAGWLDSGEGVAPYPAAAWLGAGVGAAIAAVRVRPRAAPTA